MIKESQEHRPRSGKDVNNPFFCRWVVGAAGDRPGYCPRPGAGACPTPVPPSEGQNESHERQPTVLQRPYKTAASFPTLSSPFVRGHQTHSQGQGPRKKFVRNQNYSHKTLSYGRPDNFVDQYNRIADKERTETEKKFSKAAHKTHELKFFPVFRQ